MSEKNVEIVRRFIEAGQRSLAAYRKNPRSGAAAMAAGNLDPESQEVLALLGPEVEFNAIGSALFGGPVRGHLGWVRMWDDLLAASDDYRLIVHELVDLGGGEVLAEVDLLVRWKASGIEQSDRVCYVVTLRNELMVRVDSYRDRAEALDAVGLSEQDTHADS